MKLFLLTLISLVLTGYSAWASQPKCLFLSSYNQGYEWSDGVERGLRSVLDGKCDVQQFDMDTRRNKTDEWAKQKADEFVKLVGKTKPDVIIVADDPAAKFIIKPHFQKSKTPVIFCGINWSAAEYGFPFANMTGMIEVAPIKPLIQRAQQLSGNSPKAMYLGAAIDNEKKNFKFYKQFAAELGVELAERLVNSTEDWIKAYKEGQQYGFIFIGTAEGIPDWNQDLALQEIADFSKVITITDRNWMMPLTMFGLTKVPKEQGEWAGEAALRILNGEKAGSIPIVENSKWDVWVNKYLLYKANIEMVEAENMGTFVLGADLLEAEQKTRQKNIMILAIAVLIALIIGGFWLRKRGS